MLNQHPHSVDNIRTSTKFTPDFTTVLKLYKKDLSDGGAVSQIGNLSVRCCLTDSAESF